MMGFSSFLAILYLAKELSVGMLIIANYISVLKIKHRECESEIYLRMMIKKLKKDLLKNETNGCVIDSLIKMHIITSIN